MATARSNPLEALFGYRLRQASVAVMAALARDLGAIGLRPSEASVLLLIAANPGITQSEIGRMLGIQRANMAPLAATLERHGLLARERVNGRSHGLVVTPDGAARCDQARAAMHAHDTRFFDGLPATDRDRLDRILAALQGSASVEV